MENTKVDLINSIVELSDALQILIVLAADNKDPDYLKYENKAADILKQQYGAFSLYFNEIRHTRDIEELYRVMGDYLSHLERNSSDSNMLLYCLPWINVYGHNGYITEKPPFVDEWETTEQIAEPEPQNKDLHYYCQKAIEKGYMVKVTDGYRITKEWTKALLAYFLKHFLNTDGTFPDKKYCLMFGESRLSKSADQLSMNKNGGGKPRGYEMVEELLQE